MIDKTGGKSNKKKQIKQNEKCKNKEENLMVKKK